MKKLGISIVGVMFLATIYYFAVGSEQITQEIKSQVNSELTKLKENGFLIEEREIKPSEEHFVVVFDDPKKMQTFFTKQGAKMSIEDASALKGLKVGIDAKYLADTYSVLSLDVYPLNLPTSITESKMNEEDKAVIEQLNKMLDKKAILIHADFNKLLSSFKGYVKDINETLKAESELNLMVQSVTFEGEIKDAKVSKIEQIAKLIIFKIKDDLDVKLVELKSNYALTGSNSYDITSGYKVKNILFSGSEGKSKTTLSMDNVSGKSTVVTKNGLLQSTIQASSDKINLVANGEKSQIEGVNFTFNIKNLDIAALKKFEKIDIDNDVEVNKLLQELVSKEVSLEIPNFEVKGIEAKGKKMGGFSLTANLNVNKSLDVTALQSNPMLAMNAVNAKTKVEISSEIFTLIAQDPRAMMFMMLIQPQDINNKKVYEVELNNGSLTVNGKPVL